MNLYLLLALAFGAMSVEAPMARPLASVVARRETRAECGRLARAGRASRPAVLIAGRDARQVRPRRPHTTPSQPRAPATIG